MKLEIQRFQDYLANDARRKDLTHRVGVVADIERCWESIVAAMADADLALRPGNLDKLFRAVNQIRLDHPEPWDFYDPSIIAEAWARLLTIVARTALFIVNLGCWVGSLWGDDLDSLHRPNAGIPDVAFALAWSPGVGVWAGRTDLDGIGGGGIAEYNDVSSDVGSTSASASVVAATSGGDTVAAQQAASTIVLPSDIPGLIQGLQSAVSSSTTLTPAQQMQAIKDVTTIATAVAATPTPTSNSGLSSLHQLLNSAAGSQEFAVGPTVTTVPNATTVPGMLLQLAMVGPTLSGSAQAAVSDLTTLLTLPPPPPMVSTPVASTATNAATGASTQPTSMTSSSASTSPGVGTASAAACQLARRRSPAASPCALPPAPPSSC